ncbi:MAG: phosphoribosylanthranilate isomerase [Clostridiales Family XIII bacterium]|jgi:phosphoribosylanthranilate isomerase|nr:phosphoribosylanthranilate isomerase [Clostridiales Family XIII bacterium]
MKIKICGLFRDEDIEIVNELKPDFIGFVFAKSRRNISYEKARTLFLRLNQSERYNIPVGVFINEKIDFIAKLYNEGVIKYAQLHGDEPLSYMAELKRRVKNIKIIKAIRLEKRIKMTGCAWNNGIAEEVDYILLDSKMPGSGKPFNWTLLKDFEKIKNRIFLAGGIDINNIEEAINFNPYCIDISSGAEENGLKNYQRIKELLDKVSA